MARSNKNHASKKETIIQLALDLFLENGYENTTITQIMKASNLSKGGMYHYFSSKEEILDAVIQHALTKELAKTKAAIDALPVEEKLICFAVSNGSLEEFTQKLLQYKDTNNDSIVAYRIRESNVHLCIPILEDILVQGNIAGIYHVENPKELAAFSVLLVKAIVETNFLPAVDKAGQLQRIEVFMDIMHHCLRPSPAHAQKLEQVGQLFKSEMNSLRESTT